jgi:hypothetical protein
MFDRIIYSRTTVVPALQKPESTRSIKKSIKELKKEDPRYSEKKKELREAEDVLVIEESSLDASIKSLIQKRGKEK